jgi:DNA-binding SARP family transcriptional activator
VDLLPTGKTGELLVLLLELGGQAASETLIEHLWPDTNPPSKKRQNLWQRVRDLRRILGWEGSIQSLGKAFRLDPNTAWEFDLTKARKDGKADAPFMQGVYSLWAREIAEEVEHLRQWGEHHSGLN